MTVNRSFTSPIIWQLCSLFFVGSNNVAFDDSGWNSFGGDASHRAYLNTSILNQFFYIPLQWTQSLDITSGLELHYATISSGYVWLTSPCCIYKIHPRHGELQTFDLHQIDQTASWTWDSAIGPAIGFNDKIIIQTRQCRPTQDDSSWCASVTLWTAAYASDNVTLLWNVEVNTKASYYDYPYGVTPSVGHNLIYYGGGLHNRNMFAVDATSGIIQYTASVDTDTGPDSWAPTVYNGRVFWHSVQFFAEIDSNGNKLWSVQFDPVVIGPYGQPPHTRFVPVITQQIAVITRQLHYGDSILQICAVDIDTHDIIWCNQCEYPTAFAGSFRDYSASTDNEDVYITCQHEIQSMDVYTGNISNTYNCTLCGGQPIITNDAIIVNSAYGVQVLNKQNGVLFDALPHSGHIALYQDMLYVTNQDTGVLYAYSFNATTTAPNTTAALITTTMETTDTFYTSDTTEQSLNDSTDTYLGNFAKMVLEPHCGPAITKQLFGNKEDVGFMLNEYDVGKLILNSFLEFFTFFCISLFIQAMISTYCMRCFTCFHSKTDSANTSMKKLKSQKMLKCCTRAMFVCVLLVSLTVIVHFIYDINYHYKYINQIISKDHFDAYCSDQPTDCWKRPEGGERKCNALNYCDPPEPVCCDKELGIPYIVGACSCGFDPVDGSCHHNDGCGYSYYTTFEMMKQCRWVYYILISQNAKIFQYATILSFVFIDAVFYLCVVLMLSSCSGCGIMYMQQCISCCCSCSPEHCPHCRDHKCYPCANRSCTNECDCLCFCICVPIMPQCCWIGLGLGVIAFLVVLVVVTLVIVSIIGMIPLFIIICIVSIPLVCVRHNMQCKAYCIDMVVMFERVLRINTVEVEQKKFTLSFGEYIERNDDEYITQTMTNMDEESEYWFESEFDEFEAIELVTKPQITQKIEKCEMEKGYLCFDISHHNKDGFSLCDSCKTNQTNYPQHHRAFIRRQREFMIQQSNRNQMNWLRRLNIFIPILSPLLLILFIATNQVIVAHTLMFWDQQFNWYNTWYFWTDFWVGFGDTFMNWLLLLSNKELLMEFLHDLIYFSFTW
eukprot:385492_1